MGNNKHFSNATLHAAWLGFSRDSTSSTWSSLVRYLGAYHFRFRCQCLLLQYEERFATRTTRLLPSRAGYTLDRYADPNKRNILQPRPILSKVSYRGENTTNHKRQRSNRRDTDIPSHSNNAIHPLCNEIAEDAESDQSTSDAEEPVQVLNVLSRDNTLRMLAAVDA
jgi:hypothetical protein